MGFRGNNLPTRLERALLADIRKRRSAPGAHKDASLAGPEDELSRLRDLVTPPYAESRALLLGDPGVGKTALLAEATAGAPVLPPWPRCQGWILGGM
jgi:DNA replication protein DnaC